ncbi:HIPA PROTEIN [hydrothermal vent metagenome]|uniref:HIPA PROTEIN n=1 Tax=hydrothermal vent metagenome TaxID=652676 RepID=A0A3B0W2F9_9ZZZZ
MTSVALIKKIKIGLNFGKNTLPIGRLAIRDSKIYFEYDAIFLTRNLNISPLTLPLQAGLQTFDPFLFEGLPGVFNDSLPDGWGRLLLDRFLRSKNILREDISPLDRLAQVGFTGIGALVYEPNHNIEATNEAINLNTLFTHTQEVLAGEAENVLQELLALNGSSTGARPKALIGIDKARKNIIHGKQTLPDGFQYWLVKFANSMDGRDSGAIEYVYSIMAKEAGITMTETHLFLSEHGAGYFATQRFDRNEEQRFHAHTACGLLHSDFRTPSMDYEDLLALTQALTRDMREVEKMFRLAVFNVFSHNRDDHSKNFTFLMNQNGEWIASPAYDLTFSTGPNGEQSTTVMGEGKNPSLVHLIKLGVDAKISRIKIDKIIEQTRHALSQWTVLAKKYGVHQENIDLIHRKIVTPLQT